MPSGFQEIDYEPEAEELADCVEDAYEKDERKITAAKIGMGVSLLVYSKWDCLILTTFIKESDEGVVFGGTGEPLLRFDTVLRATELIMECQYG